MSVVALQRGENPGLAPWIAKLFRFRKALAGSLRNGCAGRKGATRSNPMMDVLMLALAAAFFALAIGYTYACERL
ncbi:hypothetical protein [Bradyrhizobium sp. Cp5.3]|uniref:hypothetical protein n=1 Tax=Bradyrhizobium sp. Cp5.3 TaxID=443598 RepID=UPI0003F9D404|nr:hypothetical protein [Bradyrhizobium sp. Cp5.3]